MKKHLPLISCLEYLITRSESIHWT